MRVVALAAAALLCATAAALPQYNPQEGNWWRSPIDNLTHADYSEHMTLYGQKRADGHWDYSFTRSHGAVEAVTLHRNPAVSGWEYISIEPNMTTFAQDDREAYFAAGFAEGYVTMAGIYYTWVNQVEGNEVAMWKTPGAAKFITDHIVASKKHETTTAFGKQLARQMSQVDGLVAGYGARFDMPERPHAVEKKLNFTSIYLISYMDELSNVLDKFQESAELSNKNRLHCSALMKLTDNDFFFAHDTWSGFNTMLRQFKTYVFNATVVMSSYPGSISSIDDWYMTSNQLAVTETTNGFYNMELLKKIKHTQVAEFNRVMIANYLATMPKKWFELFAKDNSGTYNNQYMVAQMEMARNALRANEPLPAGTFYVGEQIPGLVHYEDQTAFVNKNKHWPSFNIPYYQTIYDQSGFPSVNTPEWWGINDYHRYARGRIFARMQGEVSDHATMFYMMRYNNFKADHDSTIPWCWTPWNKVNGTINCTQPQGAAFAIASRYDLDVPIAQVPANSPQTLYRHASRGMFGAIDTKMTSAMWMENGFQAVAINGPTRVQNPVFDHAAYLRANPGGATTDAPWLGVANKFDFMPVMFADLNPTMAPTTMAPTSPALPAPEDDDGDKKKKIAIGVGVAAAICVVGVVGVLVYRHKSSSAGNAAYDEGRALV